MVSTTEAAAILGIDRSTLSRWITSGKVQAQRIGRSYRIALQDLEQFDSALRQTTTNEPTTPPSAMKMAQEEVQMLSDDLSNLHLRWVIGLRNGSPKPLARRTVEGYERNFQRYIRELSAILPDKAITVFDVVNHSNAIDVLSNIPLHQYSCRYQVYSALASFCNFLIDREILDDRIRLKLKKARPKRMGEPKRTFFKDESEIARFFQAIWMAPGNTYYEKQLVETMCKSLFYTGLRREELCSLLLSDVNFDRNEILVRFAKGGQSRRIGINRALKPALENYLKLRPETSSSQFFVGSNGKKILADYLSRRLRRIAKRTGIDVNCHSFRRTFATRRAISGQAIPLIQGALGHTTPTMTFQYIRLQSHDVVESMRDYDEIDPTTSRTTEINKGKNAIPTKVSNKFILAEIREK